MLNTILLMIGKTKLFYRLVSGVPLTQYLGWRCAQGFNAVTESHMLTTGAQLLNVSFYLHSCLSHQAAACCAALPLLIFDPDTVACRPYLTYTIMHI